jgi:hypothetical protein
MPGGIKDYDPEYDIEDSQDAEFKQPQLPALSENARIYPGCCLSLSSKLLSHLADLLPSSPTVVLSIGSGYGLLEAILSCPPYDINVIGVEVLPSSNRYLPPGRHRCVSGTRVLEPMATKAEAWLFVYPKRVGLLEEYIKTYAYQDVKTIIWIGPTADWQENRTCFEQAALGPFRSWENWSAAQVGGREWETIAVAHK